MSQGLRPKTAVSQGARPEAAVSQGVRPEAAVSQGVRPEAAASQGGHGTTLCRTVVPTPPGQLIRASEITKVQIQNAYYSCLY